MMRAQPPHPSAAGSWGRRNLLACVAAAALALATACGGGGSKSTPAPPPFTLAAASLTLPVPPSANVDTQQNFYPAPYAGTVTLTLNRTAGFTDAVTLAVAASSLPTNVKADFADAVIPAGGTTAVLSIQAGYPNPADSTFTEMLYPNLGAYTIPITATSGATTETGNLTLDLVAETATFAVAYTDSSDINTANLVQTTNINLTGPTTENFIVYWNTGTYNTLGPVSLTTGALPTGLGVTFDATSVNLDDIHNFTLTPAASLAPGIYAFDVKATFQGQTQTLPVLITYSPSPFTLQKPAGAAVYVAQGQTLTFPFYLWHDDAYFGTVEPAGGTDPNYVGSTSLAVGAIPPAASGLQAAFSASGLNGLASVPLQIAAGAGTPVGSYAVPLQATRSGAATTTTTSTLPLTVNVTSASAPATLWIQNVEWGQTVVAPGLTLVSGKPALLRVQLLADRPGVAAPTVQAVLTGPGGSTLDTVTLQGPGTVPVTIAEGDLPGASSPSASTYTAILPAKDLQAGMTVAIQAGSATATLTPTVAPGATFKVMLVPVYVNNVAPALPADAVITQQLLAYWPIQAVNLTHRAPYSTATVIPAPGATPVTDTSGDAWGEILTEVAALQMVDGATANYYGMLNPSLPKSFTSTVAGISLLGQGVGIGLDTVTAALLENDNPTMDLATNVMVHEEGHALNLNHAPAGGAAYPQLDYPYQGAQIGTWGFDPASGTSYAPATSYDIMSYASALRWISDWDYLNALGFLDAKGNAATALAASVLPAAEQLVVSGWISPDHQAHLAPLVRVSTPPRTPTPGNLSLVLTTAAGTRTFAFSAAQATDLPAGHRHFSFTVPAGDEVLSAEIRVPGAANPFRLQQTRSLASRRQALGAAALDGSLVIRETPGNLHLEWDAAAHPYVNVLHEGATRTTLALHLRGGSADLPLKGLPAGGHFSIHYSDGLNTVAHHAQRPAASVE